MSEESSSNNCYNNIREFKKYMKNQIREINLYTKKQLKKEPCLDVNKCVLEWVDKYAENFSKRWKKGTIS